MTPSHSVDEDTFRRIDEVLHYIWDPIGVAGVIMARDEYTSYAIHIHSMLNKSCTTKEIADYLTWVTKERMELYGNQTHDNEVASIIISWHQTLNKAH